MATLSAALLQYTAKADEMSTAKIIFPMMENASAQGARFIALPECATRLDPDRARLKASADRQGESKILAKFCTFAAESKVWLSIGSMVLRSDHIDDDRLVNRSLLINPDGHITAT